MIFTPGNVITLGICLVLVILFRQMDKDNRSIEKVKKFGDRLKDELDLFIKQRMTALDESAVALNVEQTKAVAAVKRLESIRDDLTNRENELLERTRSIADIGKQLDGYDATIRQLLEMTALAETNLSKITSESDFADGIAKKLAASQKQLAEISAALPALRESFDQENRAALSGIQADTIAQLSSSVSGLEARVETARKNGAEAAAEADEKLRELFQKSWTEAARRADTLEEAAFAKLKEQASERLNKYREAIEEKTAALHEQTKERLLDTQQLVKSFKAAWQAEANDFLEATRAEIRQLSADSESSVSALEDRLKSAEGLADSRTAEIQATLHRLETGLDSSVSEISGKTTGSIEALSSRFDAALAGLEKDMGNRLREAGEKSASRASELRAVIEDADGEFRASLGKLGKELEESLAAAAALVESRTGDLSLKIAEAERTVGASVGTLDRKLSESVSGLEKSVGASLEALSAQSRKKLEETTTAVEERLAGYRNEVDYRLGQFDGHIGDVERLDEQLRISMQDAEKRVNAEFGLYAQDQQARLDAFAKKLAGEAEVLSGRMTSLENGLNELKARAYDNVSEKLKLFEDDFFADLAKRGEAITAALEHWKANVDERLESLSTESEAARKDVEATYASEFKERLAAIAEQYRAQTERLEDQIAQVEGDLRARITASDHSILAFVEQFRSEFAQAREAAALHARNELDAHALSVQELLRKQEREVEARTKEFSSTIDTARTDSETVLETIRNDFASWQAKNEQQLAAARSLLDDRIAAMDVSAKGSIESLESAWQAGYRDFVAKTADERKLLKEGIDGLKKDISAANADFDRRTAEALSGFEAACTAMTAETDRRLRATGSETDQTVRSLKQMVQDIRDTVDQNRDKLFNKIQSDTDTLGSTLEEIDKRQKSFIAQTKIFERADQLKVGLDADIDRLRDEITRLDVYRESMDSLAGQYDKIRKLEEEASQKVARFMTEKKRIDLIEADFTKLLGLSDSVDKKVAELSQTNDDLQQYQVQIRRFEESITEVNGRYERLEKKAVVLDQTVTGIDRAFEGLKTLETAAHQYREELSGIPAELASVKRDLETLLENREKTALTVEKLASLDAILDDVEKRTEKMQTSREWIARTETRLDEISKKAQDQLKLLGDLMKDDGVSKKKSAGAPPIGIRENVVKLAHQGWKTDEIARALHLSRGEVELILELPQN